MTAVNNFGLIFDFNGVMVDDYNLQKQAWSQISQLVRHRPVTDDEMINQIRGVPSKDTIVWMSDGKLNDTEINELAKEKTAITQRLFANPSTRLSEGLETFLESAKSFNVPRTIATSQTAAMFDSLFEVFKLNRWFDRDLIICYNEQYPGKPAPDSYILAAQNLNLAPEQCIVFEDALSGIQSASAAGVQNIIVVAKPEAASGFRDSSNVVKVVNDFSELNIHEIIELVN